MSCLNFYIYQTPGADWASPEGLLSLSHVPGASPHLQLLNWTAPLLGNRWKVAVGAGLLSPAPGNTGLAPVPPRLPPSPHAGTCITWAGSVLERCSRTAGSALRSYP